MDQIKGTEDMGKFRRNYRIKTKEQAAAERELRHREKEFAAAHEGDTDEELLVYLKQFAAEHPEQPLFKTDVPGGELIGKRFGGWKEALKIAELPKPEGKREMVGYTRAQQIRSRDAWNQKRQECGRCMFRGENEK
ncbi:MAG: hypothetical protein Q3985_03720 [Eubacteriales bacterium]|nr:hypothetical protein [Eubacteriales bacterium]